MKEIYIVIRCGGEYEDSYEQIIKAFSNKESAEQYKTNCNSELTRIKNLCTVYKIDLFCSIMDDSFYDDPANKLPDGLKSMLENEYDKGYDYDTTHYKIETTILDGE